MRKGEATRQRVLDEAARQAALKGLAGISLGDVADAVGLSKSGLFKHFDSKEAMQLALVDQVLEQFTSFVLTAGQEVPPGRARLERMFDLWLDWSEQEWPDTGCPLITFSMELDDQHGLLRDRLQQGLLAWRRKMIAEMRNLTTPPLSEAEAQAAYFQMKSFVLGHSDARRMMGDSDARRSAHAAFDALLDRTGRRAA
jgi:AcrR family transcriptional regulator